MRKLLRWLAQKCGMKTSYHVAATYPLAGGGFATLSCVCSVRPWLHEYNYNELSAYVKTLTDSDVKPNIVSITRLGI
jgi:hypothetical protein